MTKNELKILHKALMAILVVIFIFLVHDYWPTMVKEMNAPKGVVVDTTISSFSRMMCGAVLLMAVAAFFVKRKIRTMPDEPANTTTVTKCQKCSTEIRPDVKYCPRCGDPKRP